MADIHIHRAHRLGLAKARKVAWKWAEAAEQKFGMACTVIEGEASDVVEFTRSGVEGRLLVDADSFELTARLGLLLGAFRSKIEAGIEEQLEALLAPKAGRAASSGDPAEVAKPAKAVKAASPAAGAPGKGRSR